MQILTQTAFNLIWGSLLGYKRAVGYRRTVGVPLWRVIVVKSSSHDQILLFKLIRIGSKLVVLGRQNIIIGEESFFLSSDLLSCEVLVAKMD